ncbi:MAG: outer membrane protein assembly factor BamE [Peristeroidobacter soli]
MKRLALPTLFLATVLALSAFLTSGCVYKMNIQQGNYLVPDSVSQLKEGMTRSQVRFLLGTPMVPVAFDDSRWDYYYYFNSRKFKEPLKRRLTVYFADEKVARFENQGVPTQADLDQLERDLRKAVADNQNKKNKHKSGAKPAAEPASGAAASSEAAKTPDPVPPSAPAPAPAGTPSGPT